VSDRVLLIGGSGFIGTHLCSILRERGYRPVVFDRVAPAQAEVEFHQGDMSSVADLWPELLESVSTVFHLAWTTKPQAANDAPFYDLQTNVLASVHLLDGIVRLARRPKLLFMSTGGALYGSSREDLIVEDHATFPINAYGVSKLAFEHYLRLYRHLHGLEYVVFRPSNPYGEFQDPLGAQGAVAVFLGRIAEGAEITIWGDGSVVRDFLYVGDLIGALVAGMERPLREAEPRVFNIGSGRGTSLLQLIEMMERVTGRKARIGFTPGRKADAPRVVLNAARALEFLGWKTTTSLEAGMRRTWDWILRR